MQIFVTPVRIAAIAVAAALFSLPNAQGQTFDFESLPVPVSGFNNGDNTLSPAERLFFEDVDETTFLPGTNFGIQRVVRQTLVLNKGGARIALENTFSGTEMGAGFDDFFSGFSYSNVSDVTTPGEDNRYASFAGSGANGSSIYLVGSGDTEIISNRVFQSIDINVTTYTALAVRDGDDGGNMFISGALPDSDGFFTLLVSGDNSGLEIPVSFGDYRNDVDLDPLPVFETIDVSALNSRTLRFRYEGSDVGTFGLNTPAFFAADNIVLAVPEPTSLCLLSLVGAALTMRRRRVTR